MKKHIVIGASGYLGNTVYKKLADNCSETVHGTCCHNGTPDLIKLNLTDKSGIHKIIDLKPDTIIWCACDLENEMNLAYTGLQELIKDIPDHIRFIYISTMVGIGKNQRENVIPRKRSEGEYLNNYINGKIEGEHIVRRHKNHVIIRPGSIYGYDFDGNIDRRMKRLLEYLHTEKQYSRTVNLYTSFIQITDLANAIIELANGDFLGTINLSGEKPVSYYEFYKHLARLLNINENIIIADYNQKTIYNTFDNTLRKRVLKTVVNEIV